MVWNIILYIVLKPQSHQGANMIQCWTYSTHSGSQPPHQPFFFKHTNSCKEHSIDGKSRPSPEKDNPSICVGWNYHSDKINMND